MATIRNYGGWVHYDYQLAGHKFDPQRRSWVPDWMQTQLGDDMFHKVVEVNLCYGDGVGGRLDNTNLSEAPLECLPAFPQLKMLLLHRTQASDNNLKYVGSLGQLERIYIWDAANLTDAGAAHLAGLKNLTYLHISDSQITDASLKVFANLPKLEGLSLQFNRFSDEGVRELHKLKHLKSLWVCGRQDRPNDISDGSLAFLFDLPAIKDIGVQYTNVTLQFSERLKAKFPGCSVCQRRKIGDDRITKPMEQKVTQETEIRRSNTTKTFNRRTRRVRRIERSALVLVLISSRPPCASA